MVVKIITPSESYLFSCTSLSHSNKKLSLSELFINPEYEPYEVIGFPDETQDTDKSGKLRDVLLLELKGVDKHLAIYKTGCNVFVMNDQGQTIDHITK